jgi:hypothetical protein
VDTLGPFLVNPRTGKVHRSSCYRLRHAVHPVESLTIEATTTDEARDRVRALGLDPCEGCLQSDGSSLRYHVRDGRTGETEEMEEPWQVVDTETGNVVDQFFSRVDAGLSAREWSHAVETDPEMTPRRYKARRRLELAYYARRNAERQSRNAEREWLAAIHGMHEEGFSLQEIAAQAGVDHSRIAGLLEQSER